MILIKNININVYDNLSNEEVFKLACEKNSIKVQDVSNWHIVKKSIDARNKDDVHFVYSLEVFIGNEKESHNEDLYLVKNKKKLSNRPVVVGAGPAGLFAAYTLALNGFKPILLEQGKSIEEREKDVKEFIKNRKLNESSNIQFGEGGAGAFSDGKLTTNINSPLNKTVLETFVKFGAPEEILYLSKPHIGTDNLKRIVKNMREAIIKLGGEIKFDTKVIDFKIDDFKAEEERTLNGVVTSNEIIKTNNVILAIGHSARSTFEKLKEHGINIEPKPFSIGVRIEHKQKMINEAQYGTKTKLKLPPAEYKLVYHGDDGRSLYTFCMCPGGFVMPSSSEEGTIVTNGMSYYSRDGENANSALLVNINPEDYMKDDNPLNGMYFQKQIEEEAFKMGGSNYSAPIQKVGDYLGKSSTDSGIAVSPTYEIGVTQCDLHNLFPDYFNKTLEEGLKYFGKKIKGFDDSNSILTAVESRSSSPVRIIRDENMNSNVIGIHPCGEGAGYAGGIMTSAIDGIKVAKAIVTKM